MQRTATGAPAFRVISTGTDGHGAAQSGPAAGAGVFASWSAGGDGLWPAWRDLDRWEVRADEQLGMDLGAHLLVLWALHTFAGGVEPLLAELVDDDGQPRFGDEVLEDIARVAFSLGASWSASLLRSTATGPRSAGR